MLGKVAESLTMATVVYPASLRSEISTTQCYGSSIWEKTDPFARLVVEWQRCLSVMEDASIDEGGTGLVRNRNRVMFKGVASQGDQSWSARNALKNDESEENEPNRSEATAGTVRRAKTGQPQNVMRGWQ